QGHRPLDPSRQARRIQPGARHLPARPVNRVPGGGSGENLGLSAPSHSTGFSPLSPPGTMAGTTRARYVVMVFMVTLAMVTYLDRACIGAMMPKIAEEFALDEGAQSWVFFAFILSYAIFEIPTARWADRRGAKSVLTRIVSWWSVFTIATAGAFNYYS